MPRYYCDYCDTYLTHDSPSVRKQHNAGYKHKANVRTYYQQFEEQQTQSLIDQRIKEHLTVAGQAVFGQIGAAYAAWRPGVRPPILPAPLPIPGTLPPNPQMAPGVRLPIMPRPAGVPVYGTAPGTAPIPGQPGGPVPQVQANGLPGPPPMTAPTSVPGATAPDSNGAPAPVSQPMYQANPAGANFNSVPAATSYPAANMPAASSFPATSAPPASTYPSAGGNAAYPATSGGDSFAYAQPPNSSR